MKKVTAILGVIATCWLAAWVYWSDSSPLNHCEPTDTVRILLGGREYHIPAKMRPSAHRYVSEDRNTVKLRTRYIAAYDGNGRRQKRDTHQYCQAPDEEAFAATRVGFQIENDWQYKWSETGLKYIPKLRTLSIFETHTQLKEPHYERIGSAYDGLFWRYDSPLHPANEGGELYSRNWQYAGAPVTASCQYGTPGNAISCGYVRARLNQTDPIRMNIGLLFNIPPEEQHLFQSVPPQEWPAMLEEISQLMRSFESKQ